MRHAVALLMLNACLLLSHATEAQTYFADKNNSNAAPSQDATPPQQAPASSTAPEPKTVIKTEVRA